MIQYKAMELHTHTAHSDGKFTIPELVEGAAQKKLDGVAMTDHNTYAPWDEITDELENKYVPVIRGIEWTTFFGHMLVLNPKKFVDWRLAKQDNIHLFAKQFQDDGAAVGVAHPRLIGDPICTGCRWIFDVKDWSQFDYVEAWRGTYPIGNYVNIQGYAFWTDLLMKGHRLAASSGRDWHEADKDGYNPHVAVTYVGIEEDTPNTENITSAIKKGRTFVTSGPFMQMTFMQDGKEYNLGDDIPEGTLEISITVLDDVRRDIWERFEIDVKKLCVFQNGEIIQRADGKKASFKIDTKKGFLRLEMYGDFHKKEDMLLGFSSPVYIQ